MHPIEREAQNITVLIAPFCENAVKLQYVIYIFWSQTMYKLNSQKSVSAAQMLVCCLFSLYALSTLQVASCGATWFVQLYFHLFVQETLIKHDNNFTELIVVVVVDNDVGCTVVHNMHLRNLNN